MEEEHDSDEYMEDESEDVFIDGVNINDIDERTKIFLKLDEDITELVKQFRKDSLELEKKANDRMEEIFPRLHEATKHRKYRYVRRTPIVTNHQKESMEVVKVFFSNFMNLDEDGNVARTFDFHIPREQLFEYCIQGEPWSKEDDEALKIGVAEYGIIGIADIIAKNFPVQTVSFVQKKIYELVGAKEDGSNVEEKYREYCKKKRIKAVEELPTFDPVEHRVYSDDVTKARFYYHRYNVNTMFTCADTTEGLLEDPYDYLCDYYSAYDDENQLVNGWEWMEKAEKFRVLEDFDRVTNHFSVETRWKRMKKHCKSRTGSNLGDRKKGSVDEGFFKELVESALEKTELTLVEIEKDDIGEDFVPAHHEIKMKDEEE